MRRSRPLRGMIGSRVVCRAGQMPTRYSMRSMGYALRDSRDGSRLWTQSATLKKGQRLNTPLPKIIVQCRMSVYFNAATPALATA
jgi:hypothetical protein